MKNRTSRKSGFTLVEIMIVVAIIGLLAEIAIPTFIKARKTAQGNACINNLRQIDGAIQQWALELNQGSAATVTSTVLKPFEALPAASPSVLRAEPTDPAPSWPTCRRPAPKRITARPSCTSWLRKRLLKKQVTVQRPG